jgi:hypothetical protein
MKCHLMGSKNSYVMSFCLVVILQQVSGHKTQKAFMGYIKLSSDEIADEIDAIANGAKADVF